MKLYGTEKSPRGQNGINEALLITMGTFLHWDISANMSRMSNEAALGKYRCGQCEKPEEQCDCERFCCLCQSQLDIRICGDGLMYCDPCRNACDYKTSD